MPPARWRSDIQTCCHFICTSPRYLLVLRASLQLFFPRPSAHLSGPLARRSALTGARGHCAGCSKAASFRLSLLTCTTVGLSAASLRVSHVSREATICVAHRARSSGHRTARQVLAPRVAWWVSAADMPRSFQVYVTVFSVYPELWDDPKVGALGRSKRFFLFFFFFFNRFFLSGGRFNASLSFLETRAARALLASCHRARATPPTRPWARPHCA